MRMQGHLDRTWYSDLISSGHPSHDVDNILEFFGYARLLEARLGDSRCWETRPRDMSDW